MKFDDEVNSIHATERIIFICGSVRVKDLILAINIKKTGLSSNHGYTNEFHYQYIYFTKLFY